MSIMLTLYRRHTPACRQQRGRKPPGYRRCGCPIYVKGRDPKGKAIPRESLKTNDWEAAERKKTLLESGDFDSLITMAEATTNWYNDAARRKLRRSTMRRYRRIAAALTKQFPLPVCDVTTQGLRDFVGSLTLAASSQSIYMERMTGFFQFCVDNDWIRKNPMRGVRPPQVRHRPTMPFSRDEMTAILAACTEDRLRAFVLLMRYSGLRIGDATCLARERIANGKLLLHVQKTGVPVHLPLPAVVLEALERLPVEGQYYFWTGRSQPEAAACGMAAQLRKKVYPASGVAKAHSHRFRDTFAVELLLQGVPLEHVSLLLGHQNIRITQKHYAPWIRERQAKLEADVVRAWQADPIVLAGAKTEGVQ